MAENLLIPLPGFVLPRDFPWRVGFVGLVNTQLKRLRASGEFMPPRFFGYYFQRGVPVGVGGSWTVSLDMVEPATSLPRMLGKLTHDRYTITTKSRHATPDFILVHDRRDSACFLWSFAEGLRFVEASEPVFGNEAGWDNAKKKELFGP